VRDRGNDHARASAEVPADLGVVLPRVPSVARVTAASAVEAQPATLREARDRAGLSLRGVGTALGVGRTTVHRWERGLRRPAPRHLHALAAVLELPPPTVTTLLTEDRPQRERRIDGTGLRSLRRVRQLSVHDVATTLGVSVSQVYTWEHGRTRFPVRLAPELGALTGLTAAELESVLGRGIPAPPGPRSALKRARLGAGLTKSAAARQVGMSRQHLAEWEAGRGRLNWGKLRRLATVYGVPLQHLGDPGSAPPTELNPGTWSSGDLPRVLRALRVWSDCTQRELAARVGVSESTVRAWETGRTTPYPLNRRSLEQLYRLSPGTLSSAYPAATACGGSPQAQRPPRL
jgi:transcriptional regulator with XRE-family HTH domain